MTQGKPLSVGERSHVIRELSRVTTWGDVQTLTDVSRRTGVSVPVIRRYLRAYFCRAVQTLTVENMAKWELENGEYGTIGGKRW